MTKNKLKDAINSMHNFTDREKEYYIKMAELFLSDMKDNLNLTSIDLAGKYQDYSADDWIDFLGFPAISKYIEKFRNEMLSRASDSLLAQGETGAVNFKKMLDNQNKDDNSKFIVFRLPDKEIVDGQ